MGKRVGATVSIASSVAYLAVLLLPYVPKSVRDVNLYYGYTTLNPILAGVLTAGILVAFAAAHNHFLSAELAAGIGLGLGTIAFLVTLVWAVTARVDVFWAPGWLFPAQRWVLLGLSGLVVVGAGLYARGIGKGPERR